MASTGIALFAYARPESLRQVLRGLRKNEISHLYIFSDGPATHDDYSRVKSVRNVIERVDWCDTTVIRHSENVGLVRSIVEGIDRVLVDHNRVIVLEDDCVPTANFIDYTKACLDQYETQARVMHVSGFGPDIGILEDYPYDIYFTHRTSSWGWGTWRSSWQYFEHEALSLSELEAHSREVRRVISKAGRDLFPMMKKHLRGEIESWAVWWAYAVASQDGVAVTPTKSKIKNIGFGTGATHCKTEEGPRPSLDKSAKVVFSFPDNVWVEEQLNRRYNAEMGESWWQYMKREIADLLKEWGLWRIYKASLGKVNIWS